TLSTAHQLLASIYHACETYRARASTVDRAVVDWARVAYGPIREARVAQSLPLWNQAHREAVVQALETLDEMVKADPDGVALTLTLGAHNPLHHALEAAHAHFAAQLARETTAAARRASPPPLPPSGPSSSLPGSANSLGQLHHRQRRIYNVSQANFARQLAARGMRSF
ncbi:hypothetical protein JCM10207_001415, partial [Rhodosporidiobolus poonsookiae]